MPVVHILEKVVKNSNEKYGTVKNMDSENEKLLRNKLSRRVTTNVGRFRRFVTCYIALLQ